MADDTNRVLTHLLRTGLWSKNGSLFDYRRVVIDVDCVLRHIYRLCIRTHLPKRKADGVNDLRSFTLVNYIEFSHKVKLFLDFFSVNQIEPILVYEGKSIEAPLYGLVAARFKRNTQQVSDAIEYLKKQQSDLLVVHNYLRYPTLALNIFKSIVNSRKKAGDRIEAHQAFYCTYPLMTRLARDYRCPVVTDNGDFIIMDVRAGFFFPDAFWSTYIDARPASVRSSKTGSRSSTRLKTKNIDIYLNRLFLKQHPGLNPSLAMNIFPLTSRDLATVYSSSFKRLRIFDKEYLDKDFLGPHDVASPSNRIFLHAANRLESAMTFLRSKTEDMVSGLMRSEATRSSTSIDEDYLWFFYNYAVGYDFKSRLRFVLKYLEDPMQVQYIETCLVSRECTADFLLNLLCCSIGRLASIGYNKFMQYEDLATKNSAYSMKIRGKSMLMSLLSDNKSHKGERSQSKSSHSKDNNTRYSTASLTLIDRQKGTLYEHVIATCQENAQLDSLRSRIELHKLARGLSTKQDCGQLIQLVFENPHLTALPYKREARISRLLGSDEQHIKTELAIFLSLYQYAHTTACKDDHYFKSNYSGLVGHVETAIMNHFFYVSQTLSKQKVHDLAPLVDLVHKRDYENAIKVGENTKGQDDKVSLKIRHLIELLNATIEVYLELNSFFDYPLPRPNLHLHYNPILIYNLALFSSHNVSNKILV